MELQRFETKAEIIRKKKAETAALLAKLEDEQKLLDEMAAQARKGKQKIWQARKFTGLFAFSVPSQISFIPYKLVPLENAVYKNSHARDTNFPNTLTKAHRILALRAKFLEIDMSQCEGRIFSQKRLFFKFFYFQKLQILGVGKRKSPAGTATDNEIQVLVDIPPPKSKKQQKIRKIF